MFICGHGFGGAGNSTARVNERAESGRVKNNNGHRHLDRWKLKGGRLARGGAGVAGRARSEYVPNWEQKRKMERKECLKIYYHLFYIVYSKA